MQSYFPNDFLVGLISSGVDCHKKDPSKNPLIHSRITSAMKWIKENSDYTDCTSGMYVTDETVTSYWRIVSH